MIDTRSSRTMFSNRRQTDETRAAPAESRWHRLYRVGAVAALIGVGLIPVQMVIFVVWPPPDSVLHFFQLFQQNWLLGILSLDLLYLLQNSLVVLVYLALYVALRRVDESLMSVALVLGLVGMAAYFASNTAFEMLALSNGYASAATAAEGQPFLAAGQAMLAVYRGTAFDVYYVLNAVALLMTSAVMLRSGFFSRSTAYWGLLAGALMVVPSTAGTTGLILAVASLVPWAVFAVLVALRLFRLSRIPGDES